MSARIPLIVILILTSLVRAEETNRFNSIFGTQALGGKYQFTDKPALLESAEVIREMGATVMKFALRLDPKHVTINSVAELVSLDPVYRQVLEMPFTDFQMWVDARAEGAWSRGWKPAEAVAEYRHVYDLAVYLLKTYRGTGKSFYLGHWEGDNMLRGSIDQESDAKMADSVRVQGFIDGITIRQQAVAGKRVFIGEYGFWAQKDGMPKLGNEFRLELSVTIDANPDTEAVDFDAAF